MLIYGDQNIDPCIDQMLMHVDHYIDPYDQVLMHLLI